MLSETWIKLFNCVLCLILALVLWRTCIWLWGRSFVTVQCLWLAWGKACAYAVSWEWPAQFFLWPFLEALFLLNPYSQISIHSHYASGFYINWIINYALFCFWLLFFHLDESCHVSMLSCTVIIYSFVWLLISIVWLETNCLLLQET